jgi:RNA recognition motif-containing protein
VDKLFVGNLPYTASEEDLGNFFGNAGKVDKVTVIMDRETGKSRGFGFVEMADSDKAIADLNGIEFMGRKIVVSLAKEKERTGGGGRSFGGQNSGGYKRNSY